MGQRVSLTISDSHFDQLTLLSDANNVSIQDVIHTILWVYFERKDYHGQIHLPTEIKESIDFIQRNRELNKLKVEGIRDKRKVFFKRIVKNQINRYRRGGINTENELRELMKSYVKESKLYGLEREIEEILREEINAIQRAKEPID